MNPSPPSPEPIDFGKILPRNKENFTVGWIARYLDCSPRHIMNHVDDGTIPVALDVRRQASTHAMIRVPRHALITYLNKVKNL